MLKRLLTYTLVVTTAVWSVGLLATPLAVGAAVSGDLIKLQCSTGAEVNDPCKAVYYLGADGKRYVFPNEKTYKTWYSSFSGVMIVSSTEMSSYPIGGNVTYRPGVKLVKIQTDPKVYAVDQNGTLRWVTTGELAAALYGANWAQMVEDVPDAFFVNYTIGANIDSADDYDRQEAMDDSTTINEDKNLGGGASSGSSLTVALAADTPATGIVLANTINNKFTKVNLTAAADGNVVVDRVVVERGGTVASDGPFSSVAIMDAATGIRIGDTKTLNSVHQATFNEDFTVSAGTTRSIYLVGNMGATANYAGEIPTLNLVDVDVVGNANVVGSMPIIGNYQNINGTISVGTLTLADGTDDPDASTQKVGTTNYIVSSFKLSAGSQEDFRVNQVTFYQNGTAAPEDVENLELYVDDVLVGTMAEITGRTVTFALSNPILIEKGKTKEFSLQLDIVSGSSRTISFDVRDESDVRAVGQQYNAEVKLSAGSGATADADPFWGANDTTIDKGSITVTSAQFSAANVAEDSDDVVVGKFEIEARGEAAEITRLPINLVITTSSGSSVSAADITNVEMIDENGAIVAGPIDAVLQNDVEGSSTLNVGVTSTDTFTVPVGKHVYSVRVDLSADFAANDTITANISNVGITARGETTGLTLASITGNPTSATMTIQTAALSVAVLSTPTAGTVVGGSKDYVFANIDLGTQSSGENVEITKVQVAVKSSGAAYPDQLSDFSLWDGSTELTTSNNPDSGTDGATTAAGSATVTFTLSSPLVLTKGTSKTLKVSADIDTNATSGGFRVGMDSPTGSDHITAKGAQSGSSAAITLSANSGQLQTLTGAGTLTITLDQSASPSDSLMPANTDGLTFAVFNVAATQEDINLEKFYITGVQQNSGGWDQIEKIWVYNGATLVTPNGISPTSTDAADRTVLVDITNNPIVVPRNDSISLTIKVDTAGSDYQNGSTGASGQGLSMKFNSVGDVTAKGAQSGTVLTAASKSVSGATSEEMYLFRSVPIVTPNEDLGSEKVAGGTLSTQTAANLYKFRVAASSAGPVALYSVDFLVTTSTASTTNLTLRDESETVATASTTYRVLESSDTSGSQIVRFIFTNDGLVMATGGTNVLPYEIAAGTSEVFTLRGDLSCTSLDCAASTNPTGGNVSVQLLGDTGLPSTVPAPAATDFNHGNGTGLSEGTNNSFIWSDLWRTPVQRLSSTTATTTQQWSNGAYVAKANGGKLDATSTAVSFTK